MSLCTSSAVRKADWTIGHYPPHKVLHAADARDICFAWKVEHDDGDGSEITAVYDEDEDVHQMTTIVGSVAIHLSIEAGIVAYSPQAMPGLCIYIDFQSQKPDKADV
jgi:hypothetical protein